MPWSQSKIEAIERRLEALGIKESDLEERFVLGNGKGGQKVNKTANTVQLRHIPSGLVIKCSQRRLQSENRLIARRLLCERIEMIQNKKKSLAAKKADKIRKQKKRRSRRSQAKVLDDKKAHGNKKRLRQKPQGTSD